jgi:hypothetical protein
MIMVVRITILAPDRRRTRHHHRRRDRNRNRNMMNEQVWMLKGTSCEL